MQSKPRFPFQSQTDQNGVWVLIFVFDCTERIIRGFVLQNLMLHQCLSVNVIDDHSRVVLKAENNQSRSDYINASPIVSTHAQFVYDTGRLQSLIQNQMRLRFYILFIYLKIRLFSFFPADQQLWLTVLKSVKYALSCTICRSTHTG